MMGFFFSNAVFTSVVGFVLGRKWMSRTFCFTAAAVIQVAFLLALLSTANFKRTYRLDGSDWHLIDGRKPQIAQIVLLFFGAVCFAAGDCVYESQVPAVFQTLYATDPNSTAAYASSAITPILPKEILLIALHVIGLLAEYVKLTMEESAGLARIMSPWGVIP